MDLGGVHVNPNEDLDPRQPFLGATELTNGLIVVNETTQLKFFSRNGSLVRVAGRAGRGPGEFGQIREVCLLRGDTLLVIDYANGGVSLWDEAGKHVRTLARPGVIPANACFADGTVIVGSASFDANPKGAKDPSAEYNLVQLDGTLVLRLGRLPASAWGGPIPRDPTIVPSGDELYFGNARTYEVRVRSLSGTLRRIVRVAEPPRPITDDDWRKQVESMVPRSATEAQRSTILTRSMAMTRPEAYPAYRRVRVDSARRMWIGDFENPRLWMVFDRTGLLIGKVEVPLFEPTARAELVGVQVDHIVVRRFDSDGAPHLSFHRLTALP